MAVREAKTPTLVAENRHRNGCILDRSFAYQAHAVGCGKTAAADAWRKSAVNIYEEGASSMSITRVWILNLVSMALIIVLVLVDYLTDEYVPDYQTNYEVLLEELIGIDEVWILVFALILSLSAIPLLIKSIWNGLLTDQPHVSEIRYAHALLIVLVATLLAGW